MSKQQDPRFRAAVVAVSFFGNVSDTHCAHRHTTPEQAGFCAAKMTRGMLPNTKDRVEQVRYASVAMSVQQQSTPDGQWMSWTALHGFTR